jgi:hypothetical protein
MLEGVILGFLGAVAAIFVLAWMRSVVGAIMPGAVYGSAEVTLHADFRLACLALGGAFLAGAGFSIVPALHASRFGSYEALKNPENGSGFGKRRWSAGALLMVAQVAASLVLLAGSALCLGAIGRQLRVDVGFRPDPILTASVDLERLGYTSETAPPLVAELQRRLGLLPGVEAASVMDTVPLGGERGRLAYDHIDGYDSPKGIPVELEFGDLWAGCFRALGIPLAEGRDISESDLAGHHPTVLVNEAFARKFWQGQAVLGRHINRFHVDYEVVGVARNARLGTLVNAPEPTVFFSASGRDALHPCFIVRAKSDAASMVKTVIAELAGVNPRLRDSQALPLSQIMRRSLRVQRETTSLLGWLAALALSLTALGVYGMMSYLASAWPWARAGPTSPFSCFVPALASPSPAWPSASRRPSAVPPCCATPSLG